MIPGIVTVLVLAAVALAFVVGPLLREDAAEAERVAAAASEEIDLQSRHNMVLAALKDLEEDRATEKIDESDYEEMHGRLTVQAVQIMKRLDELQAAHEARGRKKTVPHPRAKHSGSKA